MQEIVEYESKKKGSDRISSVLETTAGIIPDLISGFPGLAIGINRTIAAITGYIAGPIYGKYLDKKYNENNITSESRWYKKFWVDWKAFNTVQTTAYCITALSANALVELFYSKTISMNSIYKSAIGTAIVFGISFISSPIKRMYTNTFRLIFGAKKVGEKETLEDKILTSYTISSG